MDISRFVYPLPAPPKIGCGVSVYVLLMFDADGLPTNDSARYLTYCGAWNRRASLVAHHPGWHGTIERCHPADPRWTGLRQASRGHPPADAASVARRDAERAVVARAAYLQARRELDQRQARDLTR